jgi:hypothetical protein
MTKLTVNYAPITDHDNVIQNFEGEWKILEGGVLCITDSGGTHLYAAHQWVALNAEPVKRRATKASTASAASRRRT